jgi:hypothetical protein
MKPAPQQGNPGGIAMEQLADTKNPLRPDADLLNDKRFNASIESIARDLSVPIDDVVARYRATLETLLPHATVNDYVAILAEKKVKAVYRASHRRETAH